MKITTIKTKLLQIPVESALVNVTKLRAFMQVVLVRVETDEGLIGNGYTYTDGFGGRAIQTMLETDVLDLVRGMDPTDIKAISAKVLWEIRQVGFGGVTVLAAAGLDLALWDIFSQWLNQPVGKLLGQYKNRVPMYASVAGWAGLPVEEMVARATELVKTRGLVGIKIQVGRGTPQYDEQRIRSLREALGENVKLFIDANTILDVPTAIKLGERLAPYDIFWMEEPINLRDLDGHEILARSIPIPLATGENFFGVRECDEFIKRHLVSYIQADVIRIGGITEWMRVAAMADAHGIRMSPHFAMELTTEVQCAVPNSLFVEYIPWFQSCFIDPIRTEGGYAYARSKPGLGLEFSEEAIEKYAVES